jgi:FixJ family two-component response regulator
MSIGRKVVAVVEDDPAMLRAIERLLRVHGFDAVGFASAEAFLDRAAGAAAVCLVIDIHLGGMSGIELRRRLAASGSRLPTVFITAVDDEATHKEALRAGCTACLRKPFPATALISAINRATA